MPQNMIDRYGRVKVRQIVSHFYGAALRSPKLAQYFKDVDIHGLMAHQSAFLAAVMGGPSSHSEPEIAAAHRHLDIDPDDFDEMLRLLEKSLERSGVADDDVEVVIDRYRGFKSAVVHSGPGTV